MSSGIAPATLSGLQNVQNATTRFVHDGQGFRPANQGSFLDRAINWLKETFRPSTVRQENANAYLAAKQAFLDGTQNTQDDRMVANALFGAGERGDVKFSPADIKRVWSYQLGDRDKAAAMNTLDELVGSGSEGREIMEPSLIDDQFMVNKTFQKDIHRTPPRINGSQVDTTVVRDDADDEDATAQELQEAGLQSYLDLTEANGIDRQDASELTKFVSQNVPTSFMNNIIADQSRWKLQDGTPFTPMFDLNGGTSDINIRPQGDGSYEIDYKRTGAFVLAGFDRDTPSMIFDASRSPCSLTCTLLVGREGDGPMKLLALQDAKFSARAIDQDGKIVL